jgi:hypothetical protein
MNPQGTTISTLNSSGSGLRLPRQAPARRCRGGRPCRAPRAPSGSNGRARRHPRGGVREFQWISVGFVWECYWDFSHGHMLVSCWWCELNEWFYWDFSPLNMEIFGIQWRYDKALHGIWLEYTGINGMTSWLWFANMVQMFFPWFTDEKWGFWTAAVWICQMVSCFWWC